MLNFSAGRRLLRLSVVSMFRCAWRVYSRKYRPEQDVFDLWMDRHGDDQRLTEEYVSPAGLVHLEKLPTSESRRLSNSWQSWGGQCKFA
jgi:hypothetical protein